MASNLFSPWYLIITLSVCLFSIFLYFCSVKRRTRLPPVPFLRGGWGRRLHLPSSAYSSFIVIGAVGPASVRLVCSCSRLYGGGVESVLHGVVAGKFHHDVVADGSMMGGEHQGNILPGYGRQTEIWYSIASENQQPNGQKCIWTWFQRNGIAIRSTAILQDCNPSDLLIF